MARYTTDSKERVRDAVDMVDLVGVADRAAPGGPDAAGGPVPVPRGAHAVVRDRPGREALPLLRLRGLGRRVHVRHGDRGPGLRRALEYLADRYGVELEREEEDPAAAARRERRERLLRAAGAHGGVLRARAVGVGRGGARARVPGRARARGGGAARVPGRLRAERVGQGDGGVACGPGSPRRSSTPRGWRQRSQAGLGLRPLPRRGSCSRWPTSAGACSGSARARCARGAGRSTSTRPTARSTTRAASSSGPTWRARRRAKAGA